MNEVPSNPIVINLDLRVYRLNAVKKAAYRFGDRCHVSLKQLSDHGIQVTLMPKRILDNARFLAGEFHNEVLDQELREVVAQETEGIRNLLLAQAFSATSLIDPQGDAADFRDDPIGASKQDRP